MNHQKKYILLLFSVFFVLVSCEKDLKTAIAVKEKLCFNCILNPDSLIHGSLSLSRSISEDKLFKKINNATIELKKDGQTVGVMQNSGDGIYSMDIKPSCGSQYDIRIVVEGYPEMSASTIIPSKPEVSYQLDNPIVHGQSYNTYTTYRITKNIIDKIGINRYWHYRYRTLPTNNVVFVQGFNDVDSPLIDDFNRVTDATDELGFHYEYYLRINDAGMDGKVLTFYGTSYQREFNFFMDTDINYDKYLKSTIKQRINDDGNLLFNEPVQIYTNIENGFGIFGSAAITSLKL